MRRTKHSSDSRRYFDWMEIAARDLLAARLLLEQEQCLEIVGFHCQQCMEKAFKAYLIHATGGCAVRRPSGRRCFSNGWRRLPG